MKKIYTLIFITINALLFSQLINPQQLLNKDWRLEKIVKSGVEMLPPPPITVLTSNLSYISSLDKYSFNPRYYNSGNCLLTFTSGENAFTFSYSQVPFVYSGDNADAVNNYDEMMLDFFLDYSTQKYFYDYGEAAGIYFLTITNPAGDKMYFKSLLSLSTTELTVEQLKLYPNPVTDFIAINAQQKIMSVQITDVSGKVILTDYPMKRQVRLNVQELLVGVYYISINNGKTYRFIKK